MQSDDSNINNIAPVNGSTNTTGPSGSGNGAPPTNPPADAPRDEMKERIDRLAGEQAPDITPDEFARLQRSGSLHIDAQGRVRANRREETDPGLSLRKRRAWYSR